MFHSLIRYIYEAYVSTALNKSSAIRCFKCSGTIKMCTGIICNFTRDCHICMIYIMVLKTKSPTNYIVSVQCLLLSPPTCNSEVKLSSIPRAEVRRVPTVIQVPYMVNVTPTGQVSWSEMHLHKKTA